MMKNSLMYGFILNMWIMRHVDEDYLDFAVRYKYITDEEKEAIQITPRIPE